MLNLSSKVICMWISTALERCRQTNMQADAHRVLPHVTGTVKEEHFSLCENLSPYIVAPIPICLVLYLTLYVYFLIFNSR